MASRERDMFRKYESGSAKRQKKQKNEELINKQRGSIDRFVSKTTQLGIELIRILKKNNSDEDKSLKINDNTEINNFKGDQVYDNKNNSDEDKLLKINNNTEKNNLKSDQVVFDSKNKSHEDKLFKNYDYTEKTMSENELTIKNSDEWKDPGNWPNFISQEIKYKIVKLGATHLNNFDFPATIQSDGSQRKFSPKYFYRILANNEKVDRIWLVYSPVKDCVFCFCCKIFSNEKCHSDLATVGISDWRHLSDKLISHE